MKPHEHSSQHEALPQLETQTIPVARFGELHNGMYTPEEFKVAEAKYRLREGTNPSTSLESDSDVIDVEAREVVINPESPDETEDIAELIENNDEIMIGDEKLVLTSELRALALGVLASLDQIIRTPEDELPESIDWLPFIMSEPEYDPGYDYTLLTRLLNAQYQRQRALALTRHTLSPLRFESTPLGHPATEQAIDSPDGPPTNQDEVTTIENDNILKIEYDRPTETEVPALEYEATPGHSPGQGQTPRITQ
jgi:hypothetical protein